MQLCYAATSMSRMCTVCFFFSHQITYEVVASSARTAAAMPSAEQLETQREPYFLFYRFFLGLQVLVEVLEHCSDQLLALDRTLHATLSSRYIDIRQRRFSDAIFELLSFTTTRMLRQESVRIRQRLYTTNPQTKPTLPSPPATDPKPEETPVENAAVSITSNDGSLTSPPDDTELSNLAGEHSMSRIDSLYAPECPTHTKDCPYTKKFVSKNDMEKPAYTPFAPPLDFTSIGYAESPGTLLTTCPVCGAQALLQSWWLCLSLLQHFHVMCLAHAALAPFSIPQQFKLPSPHEVVVHVYHLALRYFENALHSAYLLCQEVPVTDRLSYPLDILKTCKKKRSKSKEPLGETEETADDPLHRVSQWHEAAREASSPTSHIPTDEASYSTKMYQNMAFLTEASLVTSFQLLTKLPDVWPAASICEEQPGADDDGQSTYWLDYSVADVLVLFRSSLLEVCMSGFMDASKGACKAQKKLLKLCKRLSHWEANVMSHLKKKENHASSASSHGLGPSNEIYRMIKNMGCDAAALKSWPWKEAVEGRAPRCPLLQRCERSQMSDYFELKQTVVLLTVFFSLVEDADSREEVAALQHASSSLDFGSLSAEQLPHGTNHDHLLEAAADLLSQRRSELYARLTVGNELLDTHVKPILMELCNSSNGGTSSRARQLMALLFLLKAEIVRFQDEPDKVPNSSVATQLASLNSQAVSQTESARDFLNVTMQNLFQPTEGDETKDESKESSTCRTWRLLLPKENTAARERLAPFSKGLRCVEALGLVSPVWISMWLQLCRCIFRSASTDLILARELAIRPSGNRGEKEGAAATADSSAVSDAKRAKPTKSAAPVEKKRKMTKRELLAQKEAKEKAALFQTTSSALRYSSRDICFWHRWHKCFLSTHSDEVKEPDVQAISAPMLAESSRTFGILFEVHASRRQVSDASCLGSSFPAAMSEDYPLFSDAATAFASVLSFCGSAPVEPHATSFTPDRSASLFPVPSVCACMPALSQQISTYWKKLGSPHFSE